MIGNVVWISRLRFDVMRLGKLLLCALVSGGCSGLDVVKEEMADRGSVCNETGDVPVELTAEILQSKSSVDAIPYDWDDPSSWDGDVSVKNVVYAAYGRSDGHLSASAYSSDGASLKMKLKQDDSYTVFAIANMGDIRASLPVFLEQIDSWRVRLGSYQELKGLPMSGSASVTNFSGKVVKVPVQMLCHRLVLSVTQVKGFSLKSVRICQAAMDMTPFASSSRPTAVGDGDRATKSDIASLNSGHTADFYVFENTRGDLLPSNEDSWKKVPSSLSDLDAKMATYVELTMDYDSSDGVSGEVMYRFCLGEDVVKNFDVRRAETKFLNFTPTAGNLYRGSWKIDSDKLEDHRVLLFCEGSQNILLTQESDEEVLAKIYYNISNTEGFSSSNRPKDIGLCDKWMGSRWNFYPSSSSVQKQLQGLGVQMRKVDECRWALSARNSPGSGVVPVEIATLDGRVRDKAVVTVVGKVNWDNVSEFLNDNPSLDEAYRRWFTVGMKKTMKLSGFSKTSKVTAKIVSVSQDGRSWTELSPVSSCDCVDIVSVKYTATTASVSLGAKKAGYVKIRVDSPSTLQGQDFVVPVSDVDLRCDRNYTKESYSPLLTGAPRNLAVHCYLPGFDDAYGDGAFDNPDMNRSQPTVPYDYYEGIIPFSAFDSNNSMNGYWDKYVRPVAKLNYRPGTITRFLEFKSPGDNAYEAVVDTYGYSCCRYRLTDIPLEEELSQNVPYASIRLSKRNEPDQVVAVRNVFALPFFIPSQQPSYIGTIHDWSLFNQAKLMSSYQSGAKYQFRTSDYVNICKEAFVYSGAELVAQPHSSNSDMNESIHLQYDGTSVIDVSVSDSGKHALGRLDLYASIKNQVSGNTRTVFAGYLESFLHLALGARVVSSETTYSLPYTSNYYFLKFRK